MRADGIPRAASERLLDPANRFTRRDILPGALLVFALPSIVAWELFT